MADREKVIKGFECCMTDMNRSDSMPCRSCPYGTLPKKENCQKQMFADVYALLKEQDETIKELQNAYGYLQKQFFEVQDKLLKEQEAVVPLTIDDAVSEIVDKHYKRLKDQEGR